MYGMMRLALKTVGRLCLLFALLAGPLLNPGQAAASDRRTRIGMRLVRLEPKDGRGAGAAVPLLGVDHSPRHSGVATDPEISSDWWSVVQQDIRRAEYHVTWQDQTTLDDLPNLSVGMTTGAYQAPNRAQNLRTYFAPGGPIVIPRVWSGEGEQPPWRWQIRLVAWGRAAQVQSVLPANLDAQGPSIEYRRGDLVEWYRNDERGLEQGFTLYAPPQGQAAEGPVRLDLVLGGDLAPRVSDPGAALEFHSPSGRTELRYGSLLAVDASGRSLPTWLSLEGTTLSLFVDDAGAEYPLTLDPTVTGLPEEYDWDLNFLQSGEHGGDSVATAGDVNGDGYSEVIVGVPYYDGGQVDEGRVFVFYGSDIGLASPGVPWSKELNQAGAHFGLAVATAGDVNYDGYSDVIIGAPHYSNGQTEEGGTWVYHGSASGLEDAWSTQDEANQAYAHFGWSVATAGDVNGDHISDVIVGAPGYNDSEENSGRVWVWHGSPTGLSESHDWRAEGQRFNTQLGFSVATAGDVNADGYADIIVGGVGWAETPPDPNFNGAAYVWHGSYSGVNGDVNGTLSNYAWFERGHSWGMQLGFSVSTAGDVNGDGYADVVVGGPYYETDGDPEYDGGTVALFLGSAGGLADLAASRLHGGQEGANLGWSVATAGDVNGDGYADVLAGAPHHTNGETEEGRAYVWYGHASSSGIDPVPAWYDEIDLAEAYFGESVAPAGDVNGDGYSDIVVGAPGYGTQHGRVRAYHGGPDALSQDAGWTKVSNKAMALFGLSVSTAGDVNGDGYADVIVGSPGWDGGQASEGKAWVYLGTGDGLDPVPHWYKEPDRAYAEFGASVGSAGDVNGDGYDDVIVGGPGWASPDSDEGGAWLYKGSSGGLSLVPAWNMSGNQEGARFGTSVGTAGDANGDGYADIIVGAPHYSNGSNEEGMAWVYHGGDPAPDLVPDWAGESNQADAEYGQSVATAGDVNGDGYSDIIVGAPLWNGGAVNEGRAWVYPGGAGGVRSTHLWRQRGSVFNAQYGHAVGTAGDVNGDGYADIIVGAPYWWDDREGEGKAWVYLGSGEGLAWTSSWSKEGGQTNAHYGFSVGTAGDVNGDGYADVIIGVQGWDGGQANEGGASAYLGSPDGLASSWAWHDEADHANAMYGFSVSTAGDVNGDGYAEVIVGAPHYERSVDVVDEGQAYLYYGNGRKGVSMRLRQLHPYGELPLAQLGWSDQTDSFQVCSRLRTPYGRGDAKVEIEAKPLGTPFDGEPTFRWVWSDPGLGREDCWHVANLLTATRYHWRLRLVYDPGQVPFQPAGRWLTIPWNGWNEQDLRTGGYRLALPLVLRDHD